MKMYILTKHIFTTSKSLTSKLNEDLLDYILSVCCVIRTKHSWDSLAKNFISQITWYVKCVHHTKRWVAWKMCSYVASRNTVHGYSIRGSVYA